MYIIYMMTDPHRHEYHSLVGGIPRNNEDP